MFAVPKSREKAGFCLDDSSQKPFIYVYIYYIYLYTYCMDMDTTWRLFCSLSNEISLTAAAARLEAFPRSWLAAFHDITPASLKPLRCLVLCMNITDKTIWKYLVQVKKRKKQKYRVNRINKNTYIYISEGY